MSDDLAPPNIEALSQRSGVAKLNHTHEAIARWLLENPTLSLGECARQFNYTQSWLSCIIHSDAFKVKLSQMQEEADMVVIMDIPARLRGIAASALDGIGAQVEHAVKDDNGVIHREFLHSTAELTLKALGYGAPKAPPPPAAATHYHQHSHKHVTVDPKTLENARGRLLEAHAVQEASQLPASGDSNDRSVQRLTSPLSPPSTAEGAETARSDLSSSGGGVAP